MTKLRFFPLLLLPLLAACVDREEQHRAQLAAQTQAHEQAADQLRHEYEGAIQAERWDMAMVHGAALLSQYPDTVAARQIEPGYAEVQAKGEVAREQRRLEALWDYAQVPEGKSTQYSAAIYSRDPVDVDGSGAKPVQLVFRDHPEWKRSAYLILQAGDFRCARGCKVQVSLDEGPARAMDAWRPDTDEAIAMFINDDKALWQMARQAKVMSIQFPVAAGGTRTALFDVAGLVPTYMPDWN